MLSILYNLLEILVVLVPILLSVAFVAVIEPIVMGPMQRWIDANVVGYSGPSQPFVFIIKTVIFMFSVFTILIILSFYTKPIFCQDEVTVSVKDEIMIAHNTNFWNTFGALSIYSIYKGCQAKTPVGKGIGTITLIAMSAAATYTMHEVTSPNTIKAAGIISRINQILEKQKKFGNTSSNTATNLGGSHPVHSPFEQAFGGLLLIGYFHFFLTILKQDFEIVFLHLV